ncbi:hypothetical protein DAI22_05g014200 [Oryza sativa Japonica Group]|nr:hypothetical protein DAI22_05g014200 [Oryza sativa Japonica Group]
MTTLLWLAPASTIQYCTWIVFPRPRHPETRLLLLLLLQQHNSGTHTAGAGWECTGKISCCYCYYTLGSRMCLLLQY